MGDVVIKQTKSTRLVPLFVGETRVRQRKTRKEGHSETDNQRQRVIRVVHGALAGLDL